MLIHTFVLFHTYTISHCSAIGVEHWGALCGDNFPPPGSPGFGSCVRYVLVVSASIKKHILSALATTHPKEQRFPSISTPLIWMPLSHNHCLLP